jgi:hypothetical protein
MSQPVRGQKQAVYCPATGPNGCSDLRTINKITLKQKKQVLQACFFIWLYLMTKPATRLKKYNSDMFL